MAESDRNSYRQPAAAHSMPTPQADEPLAGLARLIGQTVNGLASDPRRPKPAETARELNLTAQDGYAASDVLQEPNEAQSFAAGSINHEFDRLGDSSDDGRYETPSHADGLPQSRSANYEHEAQWHPDAEDLQVDSSDGGNDEHEDQSQDTSDGRTYTEDYEEDSNWPRRRKIIVAAVLALALLGTAGLFGYRALFAESIVRSPPSIIKAEGSPNKIIPASRDSQGTVSPQSYADKGVSNERLGARREPPLDVPPPASVLSPMAQPAPAAHGDSFNSPPVAPSPPIPSADQAAPRDAVTATPVSPAKPEQEKTPTVSIRTDQPNTADSAATQPQRPTAEQQVTKPSDANGSLSVVPASNDAANAAPGSARTAPPAHSAALGTPAVSETVSKAPAASGGDYAVQVLSQHNEEEVQSSFRALQAKYPKVLGGRELMVRRADLGAKGVYYRAMVGPFVSARQANELCSRLKAAGGSCIIQKN
jgi:sporulation related protein